VLQLLEPVQDDVEVGDSRRVLVDFDHDEVLAIRKDVVTNVTEGILEEPAAARNADRNSRAHADFSTPAGDVRFTEAELPTWIDGGRRPFYGVPGNHWRGFKVSDDTRGPVIDPSTMERQISDDRLAAARAYLRLRFPAMAGAPLFESRVCQYENSTDHDFILDRHPEAENVWIVGGDSGHGFKHGPVMGEMVNDAVLGLKAPPRDMGLGRLSKKGSS
jgi:glycine/D-amino acid oxidase-like deaminating enzyme